MEAQQFSWMKLQHQLQQQYIIIQSEAEHKNKFEKNLSNSLLNFHTNFIKYVQEKDSSSKIGKKKTILKDEGFGNAYTFVKQVMLTLSKDYRIIAQIIRKNDNNWNEKWEVISQFIVSSLFENIVEEEINHKDIMYLMKQVLEILINGESDINKIKFSRNTVSANILKHFTQRQEIKKYSQMIIKPTLLSISKVNHLLDMDATQNNNSPIKNNNAKQQQQVNAQQNLSHTSNWTKKYSYTLKQYDKVKGNCESHWEASKYLLNFLKLNEETSLPSFDLFRNSQSTEPQLTKTPSNTQSFDLNQQLSYHLSVTKSIICRFFGEAFKYIYNMPTTIRLICKLIQQTLLQKDKYMKRQDVLKCVGNFLFKTWLIPELKFHQKVLAVGILNTNAQKNVQFIQELIIRVIDKIQAVKQSAYKKQINQIVFKLNLSANNYIQQILKCDVDKVKNLVQGIKQERIRSYSVCINYKEMKTVFQLILQTQEQIKTINTTIVNRTNRIKDMTNNFDILKGKQNEEDDGSMDYVLFSELVLPKYLQSQYYKTYNQAYKNDKSKNLLRKILISLGQTEKYFLSKHGIKKFLIRQQKSSKFKADIQGFDKVPMFIKIKYLLGLKIQDYHSLGKSMLSDLNLRKVVFESLCNQTKSQFLRATQSIRNQNENLIKLEIKLNLNTKLEKLNQFFTKTHINKCISSPKIRVNYPAYKTYIMKNPHTANKDKIWSQDPRNCFHTSSNLQFVTSLTGQTHKQTQQTQHFTNINKYLDAFAQLPEVKVCIYIGEDRFGIRDVFFDLVKELIIILKQDPKGNALLLENQTWLVQNIQKKMTRRVYERIYPRQLTYNDIACYLRLKTLQWILPQHINIVYNMQTDPLWRIAASTLNDIDNFKTPSQKMQCISNCWATMNNILRLVLDKSDRADADTTMSLIQYIILKAAPLRLYSNLNFISLFSQSNKMMSGLGYALTQLKIAANILQILNQQNLTGVNKLFYDKMVYDKQVQYGIYFLKKRPRAQKYAFDQTKLKDILKIYLGSN